MSGKITENMSAFGEALQPCDIPDFFRLTNLAKTAARQDITACDIMPGGLTNKNFKITFEDGTTAAMRVAGNGTAAYINRPAEKHNATLMSTIGIAPEIYYYDPKTGSQLCEFINADTMHAPDFQTNRDVLTRAAKLMRRFHDSGYEFISTFDPIEKINTYLGILKEHNFTQMYKGFDRIQANMEKLSVAYKRNPPPLVPCHNDTLAENFMYDGKKMTMIDWEYGGMNDKYFDIACVIVENPLDQETEDALVNAYFGDEVNEEVLARVMLNKFLVNAHWSIWSLVQICYGKDHAFYWPYGLDRANYCLRILDEPKFDHYMEVVGYKVLQPK